MREEKLFGYTRQVDDLGRLVIPKDFLELLGITGEDRALQICHSMEHPEEIIIRKA